MGMKIAKNDVNIVNPRQQEEIPLTAEQQADMFRKNWTSEDARWQMAVVQHFGWEVGNRLNKEVATQMGKVAMQRLMKELGITGVKDFRELRRVIDIAMTLFFPKPDFDYHFEEPSDTEWVGIVRRCVSYDNVKRVGAEKQYDCGCFAIRVGWYAALGVDVEETLGKCLKAGDDRCEVTVHMKACGSSR